jgi:hypothetical protein
MYGISVDSAQDPVSGGASSHILEELTLYEQYIVRAEAAMNMISKAVIPGEFIVDLLPACTSQYFLLKTLI